MKWHDRTNPDRADRRAASAIPRLFALPGNPGCAAGAGAVHDHHRFHDHVTARRHHDAGARYFGRTVRGGGLGLCIQRGNFRHHGGWLCRSVRSQAAAAVFLCRLYPWHGALRDRAQLSSVAAGADRDRPVRRRDRLGRARHRDRSVCAAIARPRHGFRANRLRCKPGAGHPGRSFPRQPMELARRVRRTGRPFGDRDGRRAVPDEAGERSSRAEAG
ncbi:hypothetical protein ACVWWK_007177 [Bradyrhizobium sp. LB9.1b]